MIKEKNFRKCDSVSSASSRRALEQIVPGGPREVQQWERVRVNPAKQPLSRQIFERKSAGIRGHLQ